MDPSQYGLEGTAARQCTFTCTRVVHDEDIDESGILKIQDYLNEEEKERASAKQSRQVAGTAARQYKILEFRIPPAGDADSPEIQNILRLLCAPAKRNRKVAGTAAQQPSPRSRGSVPKILRQENLSPGPQKFDHDQKNAPTQQTEPVSNNDVDRTGEIASNRGTGEERERKLREIWAKHLKRLPSSDEAEEYANMLTNLFKILERLDKKYGPEN